MTKKLLLFAGALTCFGITPIALAATQSSKMTCEDFIQLDEISRPKAVYWFDGFDRKGNVVETIDFDQNDRIIPTLVEECTKNPKHLLIKKVKDAQKKTASN